jgi:hypothetical protein
MSFFAVLVLPSGAQQKCAKFLPLNLRILREHERCEH